jgi:AraC-like DNA-binding protein
MITANESQSHKRTGSNDRISRTERVARERVARAKAGMLLEIRKQPTLANLAQLAGCSPSYLSRTFTRVEGMTLSRWLLLARLERAAELLGSGNCNVSEAAAAVGYRSLSHFSRAFSAEKGVHPSRWLDHLLRLRG